MTTGKERLRSALQGQSVRPPCRGELWVGAKVLAAANLGDNIEGHLRLSRELGMDILSLPVSWSPPLHPLYRYFTPGEITALGDNQLALAAVIDGPFQTLAARDGLEQALVAFKKDSLACEKRLAEAAASIERLLLEIKTGLDAVVIADDIAYLKTTYFSPGDVQRFLGLHYTRIARIIHRRPCYAFFHSDGNISEVLPCLAACGFDGVAGQVEAVDFAAAKRAGLAVWGGIAQVLLDAEKLSGPQTERFVKLVRDLAEGGNFILGSSGGLFAERHLAGIKGLYALSE